MADKKKDKTASKQVSENLILSKLFQEKIIVKTDDNKFKVDLTAVIESKWGSKGKPNDTTKDIREILRVTIAGLKLQGNEVETKTLFTADD